MKKRLSLIMAVIMALGLCGCGSSKTNDGKSGDIPTLKYYVPGSQQNDMATVTEKINSLIEPKINAHLDLQMIDGGAFSEKMNLNMASGNQFDLTFTGYANPYRQAVDNDGLLPLSELIEKNTSVLKDSVPQYVLDLAKIDGEIYAIPNQQIMATSVCVCLNKEYVEKSGIDVSEITALKDIEPYLKWVKENVTTVHPFEAGKGSSPLMLSMDSIGNFKDSITSGIYCYQMADGSIKVMHEAQTDLFKDTVKVLSDWYEKGYIRKDVDSINSVVEDRTAGKYAAFCTTYKPGIEAEIKSSYGFDVVAIPVSKPFLNSAAAALTMTGIGAKSRYPEESIKMIELLNTDKDVYNTICWGVEGKHYEKIADNRIKLIENSGYSQNASWKFGSVFNSYLLEGQADDVWEQTKKMNDEAVKSTLLGFTSKATEDLRVEVTQLESVLNEHHVRGFKGSEKIEDFYDGYIKELDKAGLQKTIDFIQSEVDEFLKNQD